MARQLRIEFEGAFYHLTSRGNLREKVPIDRVIEVCCKHYGIDREELLKKGKKGKKERQIAIYLSKALSGERNIAIGNCFGIKGPAISGIIKAMEERLKQDRKIKRETEHLRGMLINE